MKTINRIVTISKTLKNFTKKTFVNAIEIYQKLIQKFILFKKIYLIWILK